MAAPIRPILLIVRRVLRMVSREQRRRNRRPASGQDTGGTPPQAG